MDERSRAVRSKVPDLTKWRGATDKKWIGVGGKVTHSVTCDFSLKSMTSRSYTQHDNTVPIPAPMIMSFSESMG